MDNEMIKNKRFIGVWNSETGLFSIIEKSTGKRFSAPSEIPLDPSPENIENHLKLQIHKISTSKKGFKEIFQ